MPFKSPSEGRGNFDEDDHDSLNDEDAQKKYNINGQNELKVMGVPGSKVIQPSSAISPPSQ